MSSSTSVTLNGDENDASDSALASSTVDSSVTPTSTVQSDLASVSPDQVWSRIERKQRFTEPPEANFLLRYPLDLAALQRPMTVEDIISRGDDVNMDAMRGQMAHRPQGPSIAALAGHSPTVVHTIPSSDSHSFVAFSAGVFSKNYGNVAAMSHMDFAIDFELEPKQNESHVRIVCISDTHSQHQHLRVPDGDILIHTGDFTNCGSKTDVEEFASFLEKQPHKHKIVIAGNHDISLDEESYPKLWRRFRHPQQFDCKEMIQMIRDRAIYLHDEVVQVEGLTIYGSPYQPEFNGWGFNLPRGQALREKWKKVPANVDILLTHGPPVGRLDLCSDKQRSGCVDLLDEIQVRIKPRVHIFGHVHESYGICSDGITTFVNASTCTLSYKPWQAPVVFDIPKRVMNPDTDDQGIDDHKEIQ
jgi:Icc-related predicted phosphoesterase